MPTSTPDLHELYEAILTGDAASAVSVTEAALAAGVEPQDLVSQRMIPAMDEVGRRFEAAEYYVPELLIAARAMKGCLGLLRPLLAERGIEPATARSPHVLVRRRITLDKPMPHQQSIEKQQGKRAGSRHRPARIAARHDRLGQQSDDRAEADPHQDVVGPLLDRRGEFDAFDGLSSSGV